MRNTDGFTLIELMIVVAVIGILAMVAYPSYTEQVQRSRRADAKAVIMEAAQFMERNFTEANRYDKRKDGSDIALPAGLTEAPKEGSAKYYDIVIVAANQSSYTLRATRKGAQTSDPCGNLTLNQAGAKGLENYDSSKASVQTCWNR